MKRILPAIGFLIVTLGCGKTPVTPEAELDRKFEQMMKGVTLVGRSSRLEGDQISGEEK